MCVSYQMRKVCFLDCFVGRVWYMSKNQQHNKNEIIFIVGLMCAAAFLGIFMKIVQRENGAYAQISVDGKIIGNYSLAEDKTFTIEIENNHYNKVMIKQGEIYISEADCPDLLCVKQGAVHKNAQTIICLPHKLAITVFSDDISEIDAVTN